MAGSIRGLVQRLEEFAANAPNRVAYTYLRDGDGDARVFTYGDFDRRVRALGCELEKRGLAGARAVLLYPPGLDFVQAFFACLAAKAIPVPAYPPDPTRLARTLPRLQAILEDADASVILTTSGLAMAREMVLEIAPALQKYSWIGTDVEWPEARWSAREPEADELAFLQYTSGSTGSPKGVMVTHTNLLANLASCAKAFAFDESAVAVSWLPHYHDMGLLGGLLTPIYAGSASVLFSPLDFLQRPMRWWNAISKYRATATAAPNFAFDLSARKASAAEVAALDLSSMKACLNAAEPIPPSTLEGFLDVFGKAGFRASMMRPTYGLAEATVLVSTTALGIEPRVHETRVPGGQSKRRVGCGRTLDLEAIVVDPEARTRCKDGDIGEIWVRGPSVAKGYWRKEAETERTFGGTLAAGEGPYLRTGDLGFALEGELFVTGRSKDLIIVRGRNFYPTDIERTVEDCHPALRRGCGAAFAVEADDAEQPVVVQEIDERAGVDPQAIAALVHQSVLVEHDLAVSRVVLIKARTIPKTSSGKLMRHATRDAYLAGTLDVVTTWQRSEDTPVDAAAPAEAASLRGWMIDWCARKLRVPVDAVDPSRPLTSYGLNSLAAVRFADQLSAKLGYSVSASLLLEYPTIDALCSHLNTTARPKQKGLK